MRPLRVRSEIDGFIADRLLEALWREALWLVHDDIATVEEIDDAVRFGPGLRWAQMGTFLTYRIAGGEEGMRHFLEQFGPALEWPWTKLTDVPELTPELIDEDRGAVRRPGCRACRCASSSSLRDDNLVALLQALRARRYAAGAVQHEHEARLLEAATPSRRKTRPGRSGSEEGVVDPSWVDYNGHLTESRYLQVFAEATDALLGLVGVDADYLGRGLSAYTVETHIRHLREVAGLEPIAVETQILGTDEKRLHVFHTMTHGHWRRDPRDCRADALARRRGARAGERVAGACRRKRGRRRGGPCEAPRSPRVRAAPSRCRTRLDREQEDTQDDEDGACQPSRSRRARGGTAPPAPSR